MQIPWPCSTRFVHSIAQIR